MHLTRKVVSGPVTRRDLLVSLSALFLAPRAMAQSTAKPPITTRFLNNVMIAVSNMQRSVDFYQKLFGAPIRQGNIAIFRIGGGPRFFGLTEATGGAQPGYLSFGIAIDDFDQDGTRKTLAGAGVMGAQVTMRGTTPELWVPDPSGIKIQLQHPGYGYGTGPRGDVLPPAPRSATQPAFALKTLSHMTLTIKDGPRSMEFYQKVFGLRVQAMQGTTACLAVGPGPDFLAVNTKAVNPNAIAGVNHACVTIENFDPQKVMGALIDSGLEPVEPGPAASRPMVCHLRLRQRAGNGGGPTSPMGSAELYFRDPDNINVQIADVRYCGGSGFFGEICP